MTCFVENELKDFGRKTDAFTTQSSTEDVNKLLSQISEEADGLAYFTMTEQFDFDYLVGETIIENGLISEIGQAAISLWKSNVKSTCNFKEAHLPGGSW